jgi:glycosyltransferase involved in cell wall biosynthesis
VISEKTLVVLVDKDLPTDHSFIQGFIEKELPQHGFKVVFVGFGDQAMIGNSSVTYHLIKPFSNFYLIRKIQKLFCFTWIIFRLKKIDVLFTRNDPFYLIIALLFKKIDSRLIHVHQISHLHAYSESLQSSIRFKFKSYGDRLIRSLSSSGVDMFLLISESMREFLRSRWATQAHKFHVFPLGISTLDFTVYQNWNSRTFQLTYVGTLAKSRNIQMIIDAVKVYKHKWGDIKLHIWGASHDHKDDIEIKQYALRNDMAESIIFHGKVRRAEVIQALNNTKIGISVIPPNGLLKQISPTKLMEYLASGCVVIASKGIEEQENICNKSEAGYLIDFDNSEDFANEIRNILTNAEKSTKMSLSGRSYIMNERDYKKMASKFIKELDKRINECG